MTTIAEDEEGPSQQDYRMLYEVQCDATDEWREKCLAEKEKKADATLFARCAELEFIARNANRIVDENQTTLLWQAIRIKELEAQLQACFRCGKTQVEEI